MPSSSSSTSNGSWASDAMSRRICLRCRKFVPKGRRRYCSDECGIFIRQVRWQKKMVKDGRCPYCGKHAFPYYRCPKCRGKHTAGEKHLYPTSKKSATRGDSRLRPRIVNKKPCSARVLDAIERFESLTETVLKADPPSYHIRQLKRFASPNKGTQDRRVPKRRDE